MPENFGPFRRAIKLLTHALQSGEEGMARIARSIDPPRRSATPASATHSYILTLQDANVRLENELERLRPLDAYVVNLRAQHDDAILRLQSDHDSDVARVRHDAERAAKVRADATIAQAQAGAAACEARALAAETILREKLTPIIRMLQETQTELIATQNNGRVPETPEARPQIETLNHDEAFAIAGAYAQAVKAWTQAVRARHNSVVNSCTSFVEALENALYETSEAQAGAKAAGEALLQGIPGKDALAILINLSEPLSGSRHLRAALPAFAPRTPFPRVVRNLLPATLDRFRIVDVGSEILSFERDIYALLNEDWPCKAIGFDPFESDADERGVEVVRPDGMRVRTLPSLVGDGRDTNFYVNLMPATSSTLPANHPLTAQFGLLDKSLETVERRRLPTRRLDDVLGEGRFLDHGIDFLKLDVQGAAADVLRHASRTLGRTLVVHVEAEFAEVYAGETLFADTDQMLRAAGFDFVDLYSLGRMRYAQFEQHPNKAFQRGRMLWGDAIYVRGLDRREGLSGEDLLRVAVMMHEIYNKQDLASELLSRYDKAEGTRLAAHYKEGA